MGELALVHLLGMITGGAIGYWLGARGALSYSASMVAKYVARGYIVINGELFAVIHVASGIDPDDVDSIKVLRGDKADAFIESKGKTKH